MQFIKTFLRWLILSSADPAKLSLAVRGFLIGIIPTVIVISGILNLPVPDGDTLTKIADMFATLVTVVLGGVAAVKLGYGLIRKIWYTWNGDNETLKAIERGEFD